MMEPAVAAFSPGQSFGEAIDEVRELAKSLPVTYCYVVDDQSRLLGIVTMRDLLLAGHLL